MKLEKKRGKVNIRTLELNKLYPEIMSHETEVIFQVYLNDSTRYKLVKC